jgi:hypothetical protein
LRRRYSFSARGRQPVLQREVALLPKAALCEHYFPLVRLQQVIDRSSFLFFSQSLHCAHSVFLVSPPQADFVALKEFQTQTLPNFPICSQFPN